MGDKKPEGALFGSEGQPSEPLEDGDINVNSVNNSGGYEHGAYCKELKVYSFNAHSICNKFLEFKENIY